MSECWISNNSNRLNSLHHSCVVGTVLSRKEKKKDLRISIVCVVYIAGEEEKEHVVKEHRESLAITFFFGN